ncbi:MAG: HAD family hydrolase [Planctomycetes bacterium]|nr:HAD family hydrolase [Planctomycetota bacterium]
MEIINLDHPRGPFRAAVFDFDGTLSLLRRNWQDVMIPMMVEELSATGTGESREELHSAVEEFVMRLNGKQTIHQMIQLADEVARRGGSPRAPLEYKRQYHDLLWRQVGARVAAVKSGEIPAEEMTVPDARELLTRLCEQGLTLYLASGTDLHYVQDELQTLGLAEFFGPRVYGALDDFQKFSKAMIIAQIIEETHVAGRELVGFGDGFVEIEEVKKVGGLAIGVASNEDTREGINDWKRKRLIPAGADVIIGDYRGMESLIDLLHLAPPTPD